MDLIQAVAEQSGTSASSWEAADGPETGRGAEYHFVNESDLLHAYVCVEDGEIVSCEISELE